jgi:uncharacterized HAD superfamily protein
MHCLTYMGEHTKVIRIHTDHYLGVFENAKHDSVARIARNKMMVLINVKVCIFSRKLTHF